MLSLFFSKRSRKVSNSNQKKRRIPLSLEQLEPIWLFNRGPLGMYEQIGAIREEKLFDDLTQDVDLFGPSKNGNPGPAPTTLNSGTNTVGGARTASGAVGNVTTGETN